MRRHHDNTPFDLEVDEALDVTEQFWGATRGWVSREHPEVRPVPERRRDDTTGSLRAIRDGFAAFRPSLRGDASGGIERTRQHGVVSRRDAIPGGTGRHGTVEQRPTISVATREATLAELASEEFDDHWSDDDWSIGTSRTNVSRRVDHDDDWPDDEWPIVEPSSPGRPRATHLVADDDRIDLDEVTTARPHSLLGAVDPLLLRVGAVVTAIVLLVPFALSLRPGDAGAIESEPIAGVLSDAATTTATGAPPAAEPATGPTAAAPAPATDAPAEPASQADGNASTQAESGAADASVDPPTTEAAADATGDVAQSAPETAPTTDGPLDQAATADEVAERQMPECPQTYTAAPGDSWYRIADAAGISPAALLDENRATVDTVILPGDEICLPAGASMPSAPAPASTSPATTAPAPATTAPPTTAPPTTAAPSTRPASRSEVQQIIRDVWPDELEEKALDIAFRESRYDARAYNGWCCYGVFQIYWSVHRGWLDDYDIHSVSDLYDARKNTEAAYAIYQRAGGWGPWGG